MRYTFPVHIQVNPVTRVAAAALIPDLNNTRIALQTPDAERDMEAIGRTRYLELRIAALLREKEDNDEDIVAPNSIESYESPRYPLYLFSSPEACQPKKIRDHGIALLGVGNQREARLIEKQHWVERRQTVLSVPVTLTAAQCAQLNATPVIDTHHALEMTLTTSTVLDPLLQQILKTAKRPIAHPDDYWLPIQINHRSRHRCHCCEDYLPTITRITLTLEWLSFIPMTAGSLRITGKKFLPMFGDTALNYATYITTIMNMLVIWYMTTRGPGSEQQNVLGHTFDTVFHTAKRALCCHASRQANATDAARPDPVGHAIGILLRFMLAFLSLIFLLTTTTQDFTNMFIMTTAINDPEAWPAPEITTAMSYAGFGFNQFNDPALLMGFIMFGLMEIKNYQHRRQLARAHIEEVKDESDESIEETTDLEKGASNNDDLHEQLLAGMTPLNPRLLLHAPQPLTQTLAQTEIAELTMTYRPPGPGTPS